jgi:hypothetical protein
MEGLTSTENFFQGRSSERAVQRLGRGLIGLVLGSAMLLCTGAVGCFPERPEAEVDQPAAPEQTSVAAVVEPITPTPLVPIVEVPEPPPEPPAFVGRETVRVDELLAALSEEVPKVAESEAVAADYAAFLERFELADDPELYLDYVRIKIAFEATRAGGWWGLRWAITNEDANSDKIWAAWRELDDAGPVPEQASELPALPVITATAECDELSALFAFIVQRIGLSKASDVGLFWPEWNHVVAVWTINPKSERPIRVVVPTSQIWLEDEASLGTDGFNPWKQKTIYDYRRQDAKEKLTIPGWLASAFVQAVREHGGRSQAELQAARNEKEEKQTWAAAKDYSAP